MMMMNVGGHIEGGKITIEMKTQFFIDFSIQFGFLVFKLKKQENSQ